MEFTKSTFIDNYNPLSYQPINDLNRNVLLTPDRKILYLSIPKCGCSSIKFMLRKNFGDSEIQIKKDIHDISSSSLINYKQIVDQKSFNRFLIEENPFVFSVIRCPKERILSAYLNKFFDKDEAGRTRNRLTFGPPLFNFKLNGNELLEKINNMSFKDFLEIIKEQTDLSKNEHWRPMASQLLGLPIENIKIYKLSNLSKLKNDLEKYLSKELDFDIKKKVGYHHTSAHELIDKFFDEKTLNIFNEIYKKDILLFNSLS